MTENSEKAAYDSDTRELRQALEKEKKKNERYLIDLGIRSEQMAIVTGIIKRLLSGTRLDELLNVFGTYVRTICPYDRVDVSIYNEEMHHFEIPFVLEGGKVSANTEAPRPFGSTVISKAFQKNQPLLRSDIRKEFEFDTDRTFVKKGFCTEMIFPLGVNGKVMGTFNIACYEPGRLREEHMKVLAEIMPAFSLAIFFFNLRKEV